MTAAVEGFDAACVRCGAPQGVVLGRAVGACRHCGERSPLAADAAARLEAAARQVFRIAALENRRRVSHQNEVALQVILALATAIPSWLFFGFVTLKWAKSDVPGASTWELLTTERKASEWSAAVAAGWLPWLMLLGLGLTFSTFAVGLAWARGVAKAEAALPPLRGGPARCRLCGGGLPDGGAVRACPSCGAANLVRSAALDAHARSLAEQVAALAAEEAAALGAVTDKTPSFALFCALYPLALFAFPLFGFLGRTRPDLLWVPGLLFVPGLVALAVTAFQRPPRGAALQHAGPGALVRVRGAPHRVWGHLSETKDFGPLVLLQPEGAAAPTVGVFLYETVEGEVPLREVAAGGAPLAPTDAPVPLVVRSASGEERAQVVPGESARVFAEGATAGAAPRWTLRRTGAIDALDVLVTPGSG